ncbi:hypothetical protein HRbin30_03307 [bacterium HR30]|nr:hypothetical protein HRbin30_03307 [bacterium HR30]
MADGAQHLGNLFAQDSQVSPFGAAHVKLHLIRTQGPEFEKLNFHLSRLPFHSHALPGEFIQGDAAAFNGRIHWRSLETAPRQPLWYQPEKLLEVLRQLCFLQQAARVVSGIRAPAKLESTDVLFVSSAKELCNFRCLPDTQREDAGGKWI